MPAGERAMIITGASSGIGRSLALAAAVQYRLLIVARRGDRLAEVAEQIRASGGTCETLTLDVTQKDAPQKIVDATLRAFGRIDVVVNNAGVGAPGTLLTQSDAAIEAQWQLHVAAPLRIARAAHGAVQASHGGFVFVGSGLARVPAPEFGAYCVAKAAVRAAAIQLRRELRAQGMFVTYVDPGAVDTEFSTASGMQNASTRMHAHPDAVARKILGAIERRAPRVNAVPWQTLGTVVAEWFPRIADAALPHIVAKPAPQPTAPRIVPPAPVETPVATGFDAALEPVARRMERVKLSPAFVRGALKPGSTLELHDLAMRWAGMPNKNERAAMHEVLDALANAGYLESTGEETWIVRRAAD